MPLTCWVFCTRILLQMISTSEISDALKHSKNDLTLDTNLVSDYPVLYSSQDLSRTHYETSRTHAEQDEK